MDQVSCVCGRRFRATSSGYSNHVRCCKANRERIRRTLAAYQQAVRERDRRDREAKATAQQLQHKASVTEVPQEPEAFDNPTPFTPSPQSTTLGSVSPQSPPAGPSPKRAAAPAATQHDSEPSGSQPEEKMASHHLPKRLEHHPGEPTSLRSLLPPTTSVLPVQPLASASQTKTSGFTIESGPSQEVHPEPDITL